MANYRNGNILALHLTNFQTFSDQRFTFGPSLNYIAAPNGSGKSSIANAIALVFNGTAKTIGKTKEIYSFIKFGCSESQIEAEIFNNGRVEKLKRTISVARNIYYVNGKMVNQKEYLAYITSLKIDVNNLCTFLPQERVGEFCKAEPKELLVETLKNSDIDLNMIQDQYKQIEEIDATLEKQIKEREIVAESLKILHENALKHKEKQEYISRSNKLECKKCRIEYETNRNRYVSIKSQMHATKQIINEADNEIRILTEKIRLEEAREEYAEQKKNIEILQMQNKEIEKLERLIRDNIVQYEMCRSDLEKANERRKKNKREIEEHQTKHENTQTEYKSKYEEFQQKINEFVKKMEKLNNTKFNLIKNPETIEELEKLTPSTAEIDSQIQEQGFYMSQISAVSASVQKKVEELERQIKIHGEQDTLRLEALKKYHMDSYKGVLWLRENQNRFDEEVLEPSFLHLGIDQRYTEYVETFLSYQALTSFVVMNSHDFSLLAKTLKDELGFAVNIAMHTSTSNPGISKQQIEQFGFDGVVSDFIQCRQEYHDFFNSQGCFNLIPIGKKDIKEELVFEALPAVRRMAINGRYSEIKKSRYNNDHVILINKIKRKNLFAFPAFNQEEAQESIKMLNRERENNRKKVNDILEKKEQLQQQKERIKKECDITELSKLYFNLDKLKRNMKLYEQLIAELKQTEHSSTVETIRRREDAICNEIERQSKQINKILDLENIPVFNLEKIKNLKLDLDNYKRMLIVESNNKYNGEQRFDELEREKNNIKNALSTLKEQIGKYPVYESFDDCPDVVIEIEREMDAINAKLYFMKERGFDEQDYTEKEKMLAQMNENIAYLVKQKDQNDGQLEVKKKEAVERIESFLRPVDLLFRKMFKRFGFHGELQLDTNTKDWELKIFVKFRENEALQQLSSFRQSGGEKSLTTVLFLLALQQCQDTAFRLVDEINQGMDPVNETIVFEIISEIGMEAQLFVITPKMLNKMSFSEDAKAIVVYGGAGISKDIEKYCKEMLNV